MNSMTPLVALRTPSIEEIYAIPLVRACNTSVSIITPGLTELGGPMPWQGQSRIAKRKQARQPNKRRNPRIPKPRPAHIATGRWSKEEHRQFIKGIAEYGKEWKKVASLIATRTIVQIRTHAQKYFQKIRKQAKQRAASLDSITGICDANLAVTVAAVTQTTPTRAAPKTKRPRATKKAPTTPKRAKKIVRVKPAASKPDPEQSIVECQDHLFTGLLGGDPMFATALSDEKTLSWLSELALGDWAGEGEMQLDKKKDTEGGLERYLKNQQSHIGLSPTSHIDIDQSCSLLFPDLLLTGNGLDEKILLPTGNFSDNLKYTEDLSVKENNISSSWLKNMALGDWKDNDDDLIGSNNRGTGVFVR